MKIIKKNKERDAHLIEVNEREIWIIRMATEHYLELYEADDEKVKYDVNKLLSTKKEDREKNHNIILDICTHCRIILSDMQFTGFKYTGKPKQ